MRHSRHEIGGFDFASAHLQGNARLSLYPTTTQYINYGIINKNICLVCHTKKTSIAVRRDRFYSKRHRHTFQFTPRAYNYALQFANDTKLEDLVFCSILFGSRYSTETLNY